MGSSCTSKLLIFVLLCSHVGTLYSRYILYLIHFHGNRYKYIGETNGNSSLFKNQKFITGNVLILFFSRKVGNARSFFCSFLRLTPNLTISLHTATLHVHSKTYGKHTDWSRSATSIKKTSQNSTLGLCITSVVRINRRNIIEFNALSDGQNPGFWIEFDP